jgi:hypothetical protein
LKLIESLWGEPEIQKQLTAKQKKADYDWSMHGIFHLDITQALKRLKAIDERSRRLRYGYYSSWRMVFLAFPASDEAERANSAGKKVTPKERARRNSHDAELIGWYHHRQCLLVAVLAPFYPRARQFFQKIHSSTLQQQLCIWQ